MMKHENSNKRFIRFLKSFLPSKYSFLVFILFYIAGLIFVISKTQFAVLYFNYGFFLGNIEAKIQLPKIISLNYFINQFIHYLGGVSFHIFLNNVTTVFLCIFT